MESQDRNVIGNGFSRQGIVLQPYFASLIPILSKRFANSFAIPADRGYLDSQKLSECSFDAAQTPMKTVWVTFTQ